MKHTETAILGAGLAGLGFYTATKCGLMFDKDERAGGHIKSIEVDGYFFDQGAHICHSKDDVWLSLLRADNSEKISSKISKVLNVSGKDSFGYPVQNNLFKMDAEEKSSILKELWENSLNTEKKEFTNYEEWLKRQYGQTLYENYYLKYTRKYWRTIPSKMSIDWLKGRLISVDREKIISGLFGESAKSQAVFATFRYPKSQGFEFFFKHLYIDVPLELNHKVTRIDAINKVLYFEDKMPYKYNKLISSLPLTELIPMVDGISESAGAAVGDLKYLNLIQINLVLSKGTDSELFNSDWFYVYDDDVDICRVSCIHNVRGGDTVRQVQAEIFRRNDEDRNIELLINKGVEDLARIMAFTNDEIISQSSSFIEYTYPVPLIGTGEIVETLKEELESLDIFSIGVYGNWDYTFSDLTFKNAYEFGAKYRK